MCSLDSVTIVLQQKTDYLEVFIKYVGNALFNRREENVKKFLLLSTEY